jgi:fatty-acyl-CoA synthase
MNDPTPTLGSGLDDVALAADLLPLGQLLSRAARQYPAREALVCPDIRWTYAQLAQRSWQIALSLIGLGVRRHDHVGILMSNHEDLVASFFAVTMMGSVAVPINARYRAIEIERVVTDADLAVILTTDCGDYVDFRELLRDGLPGLAQAGDSTHLDLARFPTLRAVVSLSQDAQKGMLSGSQFVSAAAGVDERELVNRCAGVSMRDPALILYTSGTTAAPRGALLSHEAFGRIWMSTGRGFGIQPGDRFWDPLPLFHVAALGPLVFTIGNGATFISDRWFDAGRSLHQITKEAPTQLYPTYPPIIQSLLTHPDFAGTDFSSVRAFLSVAPPAMLHQFQALAPAAVQLTTYGGTEMGPAALSRLEDPAAQRLSNCGKPQPGVEIRVVAADGSLREPGEPGELHVRGYNLFSGYYKQRDHSREVLDLEGWFHTGDYGSIDDDGNVTFLGRTKEMMKVGGERVAPGEIEAHLSTHPAVKLAQVVGVPDERLGEVPAAFVELKDGAHIEPDEMIEHCRGKIASFKVPRFVRIVDDWPVSATKIQRFRLREQLLREFATTPQASTAEQP